MTFSNIELGAYCFILEINYMPFLCSASCTAQSWLSGELLLELFRKELRHIWWLPCASRKQLSRIQTNQALKTTQTNVFLFGKNKKNKKRSLTSFSMSMTHPSWMNSSRAAHSDTSWGHWQRRATKARMGNRSSAPLSDERRKAVEEENWSK